MWAHHTPKVRGDQLPSVGLSPFLVCLRAQICLERRDPLPVPLLVQEFLLEGEKEGGGSGWKLPAEDEASFDRPALGRCGIDLQSKIDEFPNVEMGNEEKCPF